jgi:hypothetical protein
MADVISTLYALTRLFVHSFVTLFSFAKNNNARTIYYVTVRLIRFTIVAVEKKIFHIVSVCL